MLVKPVVLFVDDETLRMKPFADELTDRGYDVKMVANASDAATQVAELGKTICLIVMDLMMPPGAAEPEGQDPRRSGLWAIRTIRECQGARAVPVIILSAVARRNVARELEGLDVADYLKKPVDLDEFVRSVQKHARREGTR